MQTALWVAAVTVVLITTAGASVIAQPAAARGMESPTPLPEVLAAAPSERGSSVVAQAPLAVTYAEGRLSVTARDVPLGQILREVSRQTGIEIRGLAVPQDRVAIRFSGLPLREGMHKLLSGLNYCILETPSPPGGARPTRAWVFGGRTALAATGGTTAELLAPRETPDGHEEVGRLVPGLADPEPVMRQWAVEQLGATGGESAFTRLVETLRDPDPGVRQAALAGLGQYGAAAVEALEGLLHEEKTPEVRIAALELLGQVARGRATDLLQRMLKDQDPRIRIAAVEALGHAGSPHATEALVGATRDGDPGVRMMALRSLAHYTRDAATRGIVEQALADHDEGVRTLALGLLETLVE